MNIINRKGNLEEFNSHRIYQAIEKAFNSLDYDVDEEVIWDIVSEVKIWEGINIEEIQDQVEELLMDWDFKDVAKEYILYRKDRAIIRSHKDALIDKISTKLSASNVQNQNANVDETSFGGRIGEAARAVTQDYALNYCMSTMAKMNHINNEIYIHDLDSYAVGMHNCLSVPFDDLLKNGFNTRQTDVRPANSINTACQLVAVIFQLQSLQQFGGVSATHLDWTLVPYVRKSFAKHYKDGLTYIAGLEIVDKEIEKILDNSAEYSIEDKAYKEYNSKSYKYALDMTNKELKQAIEGMYHNLNTLQSRSGNQLPFTSINYGTCTLIEGRMVTKALLQGSLNGVGKFHKTPIFPCGIFQCMKGVNNKPGTPNYDLFKLALESTSKRLYPNYANVDWSGNAGYDPNDPRTYFSTMGCRTANGWDINGLKQLKDGRGNICPVTIILPTLAMKAKEEYASKAGIFERETLVETFLGLLKVKIGEAKDMLIERFNWICSQNPSSAKFMWENNTMAGYIPEEGIRSALKHGTLAMGQIGLAETLQLLIGKDHTTEEGMLVAKQIEQLFKDKCAEYKEEYKLNFGVYYTPAENLCYTSMLKFQKQYGKIPKVSDKSYFTNSIHVPVWHECTPFEKIDIESQLTGYSSAGCITYIELPSTTKHNLEALETIVNYAMDKDIPYFAINLPNDTCRQCGYTDEINDTCPMCNSSEIDRLRRVTGYLTGNYVVAFNNGKKDEVHDRVKHIKDFNNELLSNN